MNPTAKESLIVVGIAGALVFVSSKVLELFEPALSNLTPSRGPGPAPAPSPPARLPPGDIGLVPGSRYWASVNVNGLLSIVTSTSEVRAEAVRAGFPDAVVQKTPLAGAPPLAKGDYYVTGTYRGAPGVSKRAPSGSVQIVDAWRA